MKLTRCNKCKFVKPEDCFYTGNQATCKDCVKKAATTSRMRRIDQCREYDRIRGNRQSAEYLGAYRASFPAKYKAHNMVNNAIRDKKLLKDNCEVCGDENTHAHHDDYLKPLSVRWLCAMHHRHWHDQNGEAKNASASEDEFLEAVAELKAA